MAIPRLPQEPPPPGSRLALGKEDELRKGPPSYTKLLLIVLSCLLLVPLGIGTGTLFDTCSSSGAKGFAKVHGTEVDQGLLVYQLVREQGFDAGRHDEDQGANLRRLLDRTVAVLVLAHHAEGQGLEASSAELAAYLKDPRKNGDFRLLAGEDGRFDAKRYPQAVQYGFRLSVRRYEQYKKAELLAMKALERLGPEAKGPEVAPGLGATEAWLFHPMLAAHLGAEAPGPGPQVWALVEQAKKAGQVEINEALLEQAEAPRSGHE